MRNPNRILKFMEKLQNYWFELFPDWRFGQLVSNFIDFVLYETKRDDIFYIEDDEMIKLLDRFADKYSKKS